MSDSRPRRERIDRSKLSADDLRGWINDFVGANRSASYDDCLAAMIAEGFQVPAMGARRLYELWDQAYQDIVSRRVRG